MATKKEEPIVDSEIGKLKVKEQIEQQPEGNETKSDVTKVKEKMTKVVQEVEETIKVNLDKPIAEVEEVVEEVVEDNKPEAPALEEVEESAVDQVVHVASEAIKESIDTGQPLPEKIQKVVDFMDETGGDLNDYVKLNQDYATLDSDDLLLEYYKQTKPHLNGEEINFLMEDQFSYDEDSDTERDIKRKKLALKEQVANAKTHLEETKSKYYEDIKAGSKLTDEQKEAVNFYHSYTKESEENKAYEESAKSNFLNRTNSFFGDKFKGFEYNVGEKNYRFNVGDVEKVKATQSDINNFIGKFLDKDNQMSDEAGYHKALYSAMNSDAIAKHFYEQGKTDALKTSVENSKNINMQPRQELANEKDYGGIKVKVLGEDSSDFKYKIKKNK